jgi:hypothetical protein
MQRLLALTMVLMLCFTANIRAEVPATQPASGTMSPRETFLYWVDHLDSMSVDDLMRTYVVSDDKQKAVATSLAEEVVAMTKLQKAVRDKWGKDAETEVLRACQSDTREDDEQADITVAGNHATIKFKRDEITPFLLVRIDGQWKVDIGSMIDQYGQHLDSNFRQCTVIFNYSTALLAAGKYRSADQLAEEIGGRLNRVQ